MEYRSWINNRNYPNYLFFREEFIKEVNEFIRHAISHEPFQIGGMIRCPCVKCKCVKLLKSDKVKVHLYKKGFVENYYIWTAHRDPAGNNHSQAKPGPEVPAGQAEEETPVRGQTCFHQG